MKLNSFHIRLLLWGWSLLLGLLIILFFYSTNLVQRDLTLEAEKEAMNDMDTVHWLMSRHGDFKDFHELDTWMEDLGRHLDIRISYVIRGKVVADTKVPFAGLAKLDDHSRRPEIVQAMDGGVGIKQRFSATLGKELIYVAKAVEPVGGVPAGVLRLAIPASVVHQRLGSLQSEFLTMFLGGLVITALLFFMLVRGVTGSITAFSELAEHIGGGDYSRRIHEYPAREFKPLAKSINTMAENLQQHVRTIEDQKRQLTVMFESMRDGILVLDSDGRVESYNSPLKAMIPGVKNGIGKKPLEARLSLELHDAVETMVALGDEADHHLQIEPVPGRYLDVTMTPYLDHKGEQKYVVVFHDVTLTKQNERAFRDFVANASHQLRTPLTSIKGYAETLLTTPPRDEAMARKFLDTILKNVDQLSGAVTSMLVLAKSERMGKAEPPGPVDAGEVLDRCFDLVAPQASSKKVELVGGFERETISVMATDEGLFHIFQNLLDNAVRMSPEGGTIEVTSEQDGEHIEFAVKDQGPGIHGGDREKVFERFYRVDQNTVLHDGSAGLGLSICRQVVENLGGRIWVESPEDGGAEFHFTLKQA